MDTSTGVLMDVKAISALVHKVAPNTLVVVDGAYFKFSALDSSFISHSWHDAQKCKSAGLRHLTTSLSCLFVPARLVGCEMMCALLARCRRVLSGR